MLLVIGERHVADGIIASMQFLYKAAVIGQLADWPADLSASLGGGREFEGQTLTTSKEGWACGRGENRE